MTGLGDDAKGAQHDQRRKIGQAEKDEVSQAELGGEGFGAHAGVSSGSSPGGFQSSGSI